VHIYRKGALPNQDEHSKKGLLCKVGFIESQACGLKEEAHLICGGYEQAHVRRE